MANSKAISIRIPDELLEKIDQLAEEKYKSHKGTPNRSLVILDAIVAYFDTLSDTNNSRDIISVSDSVSTVEFSELREMVLTLSDSVKKLALNSKLSECSQHSQQGQLSIIATSDSETEVGEGLTPVELAQRLGKKPGDVTSKKAKVKDTPEKFSEWAKQFDPDGWGWEFREKDGKRVKYFPIKPLA